MLSSIEFVKSKPFICINGENHFPIAYTTYFEECAQYEDFINCGYKMYFVNVSFTDLPINNVTGFSPFTAGVFESAEADYNEFDETVSGILALCPDALIFPRIHVAMPRKWINENPDECVSTPSGNRESFCSDKYFTDGAMLLKQLVSHIRSSSYSDSIAGYQVCGGTTQEWMHHDLAGSFSELSMRKFRLWMKERYKTEFVPEFTKDDLFKAGFNAIVSRYGEFCCEAAANAVEHFARMLKEYISNEQIVGAFYGYNAFVNDPLLGLLGLRHIISSKYIDFFSSPCCYDCNRELGVDWGDMLPQESLKNYGKLYFVECDIRTHLTRRMQDSRPGKYSDNIYTLVDSNGNRTVWKGPDSVELSASAIKKALAHQLAKGSGVWWFDMWGGWYHDSSLLGLMKDIKAITEKAEEKNSATYPDAEVALFVDESAYFNNPRCSEYCHTVNAIRVAMGNTGIPFDICMTEDAPKLLGKYKFAIFTAVFMSESGQKAVELCEKAGIPYLMPDEEKYFYSTNELRDVLIKAGVHCYNADNNVIYCGNGYLCVHASKDGGIKISLPGKYWLKQLFSNTSSEYCTDELLLHMKKHDTILFELL